MKLLNNFFYKYFCDYRIYMAQFVIGLAAGIYIGTYYDCKPGLKIASETFEQYCPKREPVTDYKPINGMDENENDDDKKKEKNIEMSSVTGNLKKWF